MCGGAGGRACVRRGGAGGGPRRAAAARRLRPDIWLFGIRATPSYCALVSQFTPRSRLFERRKGWSAGCEAGGGRRSAAQAPVGVRRGSAHASTPARAMDDKPTAVGGEEHYSLRWNNHQAHLLRSFEALLHAETLVDVTLVCAERRVRAHKVLLGACSPLFRRIFSENPCKHPVIVLKDFQGWEVQAVVDFMYRGEVSVAQEQLGTVIRAGESLQVRGLADQDREERQERSPTPVARSPAQATPAPSPPVSPASPQPRRKQARPRRRSGESDTPENLSMRRSPSGLKAVRLARPRSPPKEADEPENEAPPPPRMFPPHQDMFPPVPPSAVSALSLTPPHRSGNNTKPVATSADDWLYQSCNVPGSITFVLGLGDCGQLLIPNTNPKFILID
ncbi:unnamed protein product [Diatraea saccharalis]|uniref:BTB domain-containing protein n=1 Tax=Diatraea saccharalis TaxID=40085 RepID=A0A9N9WEP6_9NEOP|nr:unnamed protein product [Diatraea saccharalis]